MNKQLNFHLEAIDGYAGLLSDFLVDTRSWVVRYAVIDTGPWLPGRTVVLARSCLSTPDFASRSILLSCTREWLEAGPRLAAGEPVTRNYEERLYAHFAWLPYWNPGDTADPQLLSFRRLVRHHAAVNGRRIGRIDDLLRRDDTWEAPFLIARAGGWFHKQDLMVPMSRARGVSEADHRVNLELNRAELNSLEPYWPSLAAAGQMEGPVFDIQTLILAYDSSEDAVRHT